MQIQLIALALAASAAMANPTTMAKRAVVTYDCNVARADCQTKGTSTEVCDQQFTACEGCATQEHSCRIGSKDNYSGQLQCTESAQKCYNAAVSPGSVLGAYGCQEARDTCDTADRANHAFCASQFSGCTPCESQEQSCRTAPGANMSFCSSQATGCFDKAMGL